MHASSSRKHSSTLVTPLVTLNHIRQDKKID
jgi:hypothetical protein